MRILFLLLLHSLYLFSYEQESTLACLVTSKIAKFTQENNDALNPYTITVLHNQFGNQFDDIFKNITINNKKVKILYIDDIKSLKKSNILFIFDADPKELRKISTFIKDKHILTMSMMRGFAQRDGMIEIDAYNQKLKLKINLQNVKREHIYINSALLRIAEIIKNEDNS